MYIGRERGLTFRLQLNVLYIRLILGWTCPNLLYSRLAYCGLFHDKILANLGTLAVWILQLFAY